MSYDEKTAIVDELDRRTGRMSRKILNWILAGFVAYTVTVAGAVVWATKFYVQVQLLITNQDEAKKATEDRVEKWTTWRKSVDDSLWTLAHNSGDRWKKSFQREYNAELFNMNGGAVKTPNVDDIANRLSQ